MTDDMKCSKCKLHSSTLVKDDKDDWICQDCFIEMVNDILKKLERIKDEGTTTAAGYKA